MAMSADGTQLQGVGTVARRVGVTPKTLRHYDRIGLLRPALVDDAGYRWHAAEQIEVARRTGVQPDLHTFTTCVPTEWTNR